MAEPDKDSVKRQPWTCEKDSHRLQEGSRRLHRTTSSRKVAAGRAEQASENVKEQAVCARAGNRNIAAGRAAAGRIR